MNRTVHIVEKFTMELEGPDPERDSWFLDYALRDPKHAGVHLTAGWLALQSLNDIYAPDQIETVWESFGGMGAQALMVGELWQPSEHTICEYSPDAVAHLERVFRHVPDTSVIHRDAYGDDPISPADLFLLDFGDLTAWKTRDGQPHRKLLDRVFATDPKAVVFTDIACRYLHLHKSRYESLLGADTCGSYGTYLRALLARLEALYGFSLVAGYWDRWSTVMALVPAELVSNRGSLQETPDAPVGLKVESYSSR